MVNQDDPEVRIAELERRLVEHQSVQPAVTSEEVRNVAFSKSAREERGYDESEVDAFLDRVETALRDPGTRAGVTPADIHNVTFSKPPMAKRGYNADEVDAFLDRVRIELTRRIPGHDPEEPIRCLLYRYASWDPQTPVLAIDVGRDAIRVTDLNSDTLIATISVTAVTAKPAHYGGSPVLVVDGPGLETLTITPHPAPGTWRKRPKSKKPAYLAIDTEWLTLAEKFGLASDLVGESTPQNFLEHILAFRDETREGGRPWTWRAPLVLGLLLVVAACLPPINPLMLVAGVGFLIWAVLAWRFGWEF